MDAKPYEPGQKLPGTVYRVVRHLATGGMGSVYDVEDVTVGKRYVLKTLHPQLLSRQDLARRMEAEARTLAKLEHPNIVEVVTAGVTTGDLKVPFYVMERLNGQNLRVVLDKKSALDLPHCYRIAIDVLDALEHAHENAVIHRDVKPENIFLHRNPNGTTVTKLLDFGIMRLLDRKSSQTQGKFIGTLRYASPEQILGGELGPATDIYSLGVVLYEMICGRGPFDDAGDAYAIGAAHAQRPPPPLSRFVHVPGAVEALVMSALAKDPRVRPRDCFTMATELRKLRRIDEAAPRVETVATVLSMREPEMPGGAVVSPLPADVAPSKSTASDKPVPGVEPTALEVGVGLEETALSPETAKMNDGAPAEWSEHVVASKTVPLHVPEAAPSPPKPGVVAAAGAANGPVAAGEQATQLMLERPSDKGVDREAVTHASIPVGTTRRLAVHGTLMDDALSPITEDDLVRRAFDEPQPLAVPSMSGSTPGDIVFPPLTTSPATTGDGLLVGVPGVPERRKFVVPLLAALAFGGVTAGIVAIRATRSASVEAQESSTAAAAPSPVAPAAAAPSAPAVGSASPLEREAPREAKSASEHPAAPAIAAEPLSPGAPRTTATPGSSGRSSREASAPAHVASPGASAATAAPKTDISPEGATVSSSVSKPAVVPAKAKPTGKPKDVKPEDVGFD